MWSTVLRCFISCAVISLPYLFFLVFPTFILTTNIFRTAILQKMDTSLGLSSIATLSLGLSMSMSGAGGWMLAE